MNTVVDCRRSAIFTPEQEGETRGFTFTHEQNIICSQAQLADTGHKQTIISRQLFAGHGVDPRPMKWKENKSINNDIKVAHPLSGSSSARFLVELEIKKGWFLRGGENRSTRRKTSRSKGEN